MSTTLIRDTSLLFPEWAPLAPVLETEPFEHLRIEGFEEEWTPETVTLHTQVVLESTVSFELFGFEFGLGDPEAGEVEAQLSVTLDSVPVVSAIGVLLLGAGQATAEDLAEAVERLGLEEMTAAELTAARTDFEASGNDQPDVGDLRAELSGLELGVGLPRSTFQTGRLLEADGEVVGIEPHPDDPRPRIALGEASIVADTASGISVDAESPDGVAVPPLLFRDTDVGFVFRDVLADLSETSTPPVVDAMPGYDAAWRGFYVGDLTIWGLQSWLPFLPRDLDSSVADGTSLRFSEWLIDERGLVGEVTLDLPTDHPDHDVWALDRLTLGFDRDWVPELLSATVELRLAELDDAFDPVGSDGTVSLTAELRYDPAAPAPARFGFDLVAEATDEGSLLELRRDDHAAAMGALYGTLAGLSVAAGDGALAFTAALAALEGADIVRTERVAIEALTFAYDVEPAVNGQWRRVLVAEFDCSTDLALEIDEADVDTPLGLRSGTVRVEYTLNHAALSAAGVSVDPVVVDWETDELELSLQAAADVGNAVTITEVALRLEDGWFLVELGIDTEGAGDVAIGGIADAIVLAVDENGDIEIRLGTGMPVTLLVPGVLYATGELQTGAEAVELPPAGQGMSWTSAMAGSLRGFLIGNGTASTPADHTKRESYMLGLDVGLLSASRSDGMTTVVVSIDGTFNPGIPLGTSGVSLYGLGLLYAQNAQPALPGPGDYAGWYMDEAPAYTAHASKWEPAPDEWGFGASTILGSAPDDARSWSAKVGLLLLLPGPVIALAGTGDTFAEKPSLGGGESPPFAAVMVLDLDENVLSVDLQISLAVPEGEDDPDLLTLTIPTEVFVNLDDPTDFHLYMGQYAPPEARVVAEALGMLDLSAYLMLDGSAIRGLPTVDPLPGLALALGGEASVDWGLKSSVVSAYLYADAEFHLGVSLADPPLLVGLIRIEGGLVVKVFGFGFDLGIYAGLAGRAPEPFFLEGEVGIRIGLPWPFDDIDASARMRFGTDGPLPEAPDPFVDCQLRPRRLGAALSLAEATDEGETPVVPVDPVFALSFDTPLNGVGTVDSFTVSSVDGGNEVWSVVTTEEVERAGIERRHRLGYRYELVGCELRNVDTGAVLADVPATWTPSGEGTAAASGGQPARTDLLLFTHEATALHRSVGMGGELSNRQLQAWDPCFLKKPQNRREYDVNGLPVGPFTDPLGLRFEGLETTGDPPVWARIAPEGSAATRRLVDADAVAGSVVRPPFEPHAAPAQPLRRDRVVGVPQVLPRTHLGQLYLSALIGLESAPGDEKPPEITPPVDPLDVVLPAHEHASVLVLVADDVELVAVGMVDGRQATERLPLTPVGDRFALQRDLGEPPRTEGRWQFFECAPPRPVEAIRLFAVRAPNLEHVPAALDGMAASVLSVTVRFGDRIDHAENETFTELTSDLVDARLRGEHLDMLEPDTEYELAVTVEARHAEQWGEDPVEVGDLAIEWDDPDRVDGRFTEQFRFRTASEPPDRLRGTEAPDGARDDWELHVTPRGAVPHYTASPAAFRFRTDRTLAEYAAHRTALALRLVDAEGVSLFEELDAVAARAGSLPAEQEAWRSKLGSLSCVDDGVDELWREATATITSLLEPETRYTAALHVVDETAPLDSVDWAAAPVAYAWRFRTSRWETAGDHLRAHEAIDELTDRLADAATLRAAVTAVATPATTDGDVTVDDTALDGLLFDTLGLPPREPPSTPEAIRVWRWDPATDATELVALVVDGPEPLLRDGTTPFVRQGGSVCAGRYVTGVAGARGLFVPDAGEVAPGQPVRMGLSSATGTLDLPIPARPTVLTDGGAP